MNKNDKDRIDRFFNGNASNQEMVEILFDISMDPELEEYAVYKRRQSYIEELDSDYRSFIPASSMAADDGDNLCDFQCEEFILKSLGVNIDKYFLVKEAKANYWLRDQGTPLYNIGKLMQVNGLYVERAYGEEIDKLIDSLSEFKVIVVVNGDLLKNSGAVQELDDYEVEKNPNHAVVVLSASKDNNTITLYNPATDGDNETSEYPLDLFEKAWYDSNNYVVKARKKKEPYEYNPQPMDLRCVAINDELQELIEMISSEVHDVWAVDKKKKCPGIRYAPANEDGSERDNMSSQYLLPYEMLTEVQKENDRKMVRQTIKLLKRLGYRLSNINNMYKCPECGNGVEPDYNFCSCCGKKLSWEVFR